MVHLRDYSNCSTFLCTVQNYIESDCNRQFKELTFRKHTQKKTWEQKLLHLDPSIPIHRHIG